MFDKQSSGWSLGFVARRLLRSNLDWVTGILLRRALNALRTSPEIKIAQRHLYHYYRNRVLSKSIPPLNETGFRCFSQFDEDGKLLFIFAALGVSSGTFVDIGSADGINSNCANLALNFSWDGVFIDASQENIRVGRNFYQTHPDTWAHPPRFVHSRVTRGNINPILEAADVLPVIDLLSIDIDGNDYWVWESIEGTTASVVIIETSVEFGNRSIVVPYRHSSDNPPNNPHYRGASVPAMVKLARKKGYRLVGANNYGFNTIFIRQGLGEDILPEVSVESVLSHPRNIIRSRLFEAIEDLEYIEV